MDTEEREDEPVTLAPRVFAGLVAILLCLVLVPFFYWLADQRLLLWADEVRWRELRRQPATSSRIVVSTDRLEMHRSICLGLCPQYDLVLFASGRVEFTGEMFVCVVGRHTAQVDSRAATKLIADFANSGYFELRWKIGELWTDAPTVRTRLIVGTQSRTIEHYHGDMGAPRVLHEMERSIDEVAGTARWLAKGDASDHYCLTPEGKRTRWLRSPDDSLATDDVAPQ